MVVVTGAYVSHVLLDCYVKVQNFSVQLLYPPPFSFLLLHLPVIDLVIHFYSISLLCLLL